MTGTVYISEKLTKTFLRTENNIVTNNYFLFCKHYDHLPDMDVTRSNDF